LALKDWERGKSRRGQNGTKWQREMIERKKPRGESGLFNMQVVEENKIRCTYVLAVEREGVDEGGGRIVSGEVLRGLGRGERNLG